MTSSVYVIGGAGAGKSTFMKELLSVLGAHLSPAEVLWGETLYSPHHGRDYLVELIGHRWADGVYLGVMRDQFPGADALVRTTGPVARAWLAKAPLPPIVVGEGLLLSSLPFLEALHAATDLLVVHLHVPEEERLRRVRHRGHEFNEGWSRQTVSRARNTAAKLRRAGIRVVDNATVPEAALHALGL